MSTLISIWDPLDTSKKRIISLPNKIRTGPADDQIQIPGFSIKPDRQRNFIKNSYSEEELNAIHIYAVIRRILNMYEEILGFKIKWFWNNQRNKNPIKAFFKNYDSPQYDRYYEAIYLGEYRKDYTKIYYKSCDSIAHELTHAILDSLRPLWYRYSVESLGLIESMCDLSGLFFKLTLDDLVDDVLFETKNVLESENILTRFADGCGIKGAPIRSILSSRYFEPKLDRYQYAEVFSAAIYCILIQYFYLHFDSQKSQNVMMNEVSQVVMRLILESVLKSSKSGVNFAEFGLVLLKNAPEELKLIIKPEFEKRKII